MDKEKYIAIFMTTLMIALPIGAMMILIVYAFGIMAVPEHKTTYDFIKDHGSLTAGIISIVGVLILIWHQGKTTKEVIESNVRVMKNEALEIQKNKAIELASEIGYKIDMINNVYPPGFYEWAKNPGQEIFYDSKKAMYWLESFFRMHMNDNKEAAEGIVALECIFKFCWIYEDKVWQNNRGSIYLIESLLGNLSNLAETSDFAFQTSRNLTYQYRDAAGNYRYFTGPEDVLFLLSQDTIFKRDVYGFIIQYMSFVVMPTIIQSVYELKVR
ncbi:hypothetical protein B9T12_04685 [Wohlfahrtiimonas chitiniclastica]|uniref:hypothetical protein n=1 Tax=Wohlfahrtiimonas chitiniclastica TaxID=400946 RepID=UPI000B99A8DB|nr:hypothetical protein [Wohlfahrtiimonas chitiniclastica]OYQ79074.1 hypothetical protein B9T12_04685 [Wohlfahrtiimonas chitiniclastica]